MEYHLTFNPLVAKSHQTTRLQVTLSPGQKLADSSQSRETHSTLQARRRFLHVHSKNLQPPTHNYKKVEVVDPIAQQNPEDNGQGLMKQYCGCIEKEREETVQLGPASNQRKVFAMKKVGKTDTPVNELIELERESEQPYRVHFLHHRERS